jgi:hypothetical protein
MVGTTIGYTLPSSSSSKAKTIGFKNLGKDEEYFRSYEILTVSLQKPNNWLLLFKIKPKIRNKEQGNETDKENSNAYRC